MGTFIEVSALTDKGKIRRENQDRIYIKNVICSDSPAEKTGGIYPADNMTLAVFDGMGGETHGEKAARIALDYMLSVPFDSKSTEQICLGINERICLYMKERAIRSMGSTAVLIRFRGEKAEICNIGDSRLYSVTDDGIEQLSHDHSMMVGKMRPRRVLTQHLGIPANEMLIEPYCTETKCSENQTFILCSDGLTDFVSDEIIFETVRNETLDSAVKKLYYIAMENGGRDNISIILCKLK